MCRSSSEPAILARGRTVLRQALAMRLAASRPSRGPGLADSAMAWPGVPRRAASMGPGAPLGQEPAVLTTRLNLAWIPAVSMAAELARESAASTISTVLGRAPAAPGSKPRQDLERNRRPPAR